MTKSTMTITELIVNAIKSADTVLVCGHIRPDGDCVGAALAMRHLCEKLGKTADAVCDAERPASFAFLPEYEYFCSPRLKEYDLFIAVDCATDKRLGEYVKQLDTAKYSIDIDHHPTNVGYCKLNHIEPQACSTCAIIYRLFKDTGLIDKTMATFLYTGLSTDTGHFMHSNTDAEVFDTAAELCRLGVEPGPLNHDIYCSKRFEKIKLTAKVLDGIMLYEGGRIALMPIDLETLDACKCTTEDTEGLIDYASSIAGVKISISVCEQPGNVFRVSFRSVYADVAAAAETFGGGGHKLAAGCIVTGNRYDVIEKILAAAKTALDKAK